MPGTDASSLALAAAAAAAASAKAAAASVAASGGASAAALGKAAAAAAADAEGGAPPPPPPAKEKEGKRKAQAEAGEEKEAKKKRRKGKDFKGFDEARAFMHKQGLCTQVDFKKWRAEHRPLDIPSNPDQFYKTKGEWVSWQNFLNSCENASAKERFSNGRHSTFLPFEDARKTIRALNLQGVEAWRKFCRDGTREKDHPNIPANPQLVYRGKGWTSWHDFLDEKKHGKVSLRPASKYRAFAEARAYIHKQGLKSKEDWKKWCNESKLPSDIPRNVHTVYKGHGWVSWADWLDPARQGELPNHRPTGFVGFTRARKSVQRLGIKTEKAWNELIEKGQKPTNVPSNLDSYYKNSWKSWEHFCAKPNDDSDVEEETNAGSAPAGAAGTSASGTAPKAASAAVKATGPPSAAVKAAAEAAAAPPPPPSSGAAASAAPAK